MRFLKNIAVVGLVAACVTPAALAQGNVRANATSTTFSTSNTPFAQQPLLGTAPARNREEISASLYYLGLSKAEVGHTAQARALIMKAIKTDTRNFAARIDYAYMSLQDNKPHKAEYQIAKAQELLTACVDVSEGYCDSFENRLNMLEEAYQQSQSE